MCETMFLHFVPVDGVKYFSGIFGRERYVFMCLCFQKTSQWTRPYALSLTVCSIFPTAQLPPLCVGCLVGCHVGCCVVVRQGLGFRWLPLEAGTQPPTESRSQRYDIARGDGMKDNHDGVGCYLIVWAIELSNGKHQE
jgi:hypothetical protein